LTGLVRFIVLVLALQPTGTLLAQSGSPRRSRDASRLLVSESGDLYYLGSFSSVLDLVAPSGICGAFGLRGGTPILLSEYAAKASLSRCEKVVDTALGRRELDPEEKLFQPSKIASDSEGRIMVADNGTVHIFDFLRRRHSHIPVGPGERLQSPAGLAVDAHDHLYITDAQLGAILVYRPPDKFRRYIGNPSGERMFERPAGIAVDSASGHIYVADPPRNVVVVLDAKGNIIAKIGTGASGSSPAEFAGATDVVVRKEELFVLDARNFRIQVFDLAGHFRESIFPESMGLAVAFSVDSQGRIYVDGPLDTVRLFQRDGRFIDRFGYTGAGSRARSQVSCIWIDSSDRVFVADRGNNQIQSFEWGTRHLRKLLVPGNH